MGDTRQGTENKDRLNSAFSVDEMRTIWFENQDKWNEDLQGLAAARTLQFQQRKEQAA